MSIIEFFKRLFTFEKKKTISNESKPKINKDSLSGSKVALVVGHFPNSGAYGNGINEWAYCLKVANHLEKMLQSADCDCEVFVHNIKSYTKRQQDTARRIKKRFGGKPDISLELHIDASVRPSAKGYHFQHYSKGGEIVALEMRDAWKSEFPDMNSRFDHGIFHNTKGNGSGFLKIVPGYAVLTEPFMLSNEEEAERFKGKEKLVAMTYFAGIKKSIDKLR